MLVLGWWRRRHVVRLLVARVVLLVVGRLVVGLLVVGLLAVGLLAVGLVVQGPGCGALLLFQWQWLGVEHGQSSTLAGVMGRSRRASGLCAPAPAPAPIRCLHCC